MKQHLSFATQGRELAGVFDGRRLVVVPLTSPEVATSSRSTATSPATTTAIGPLALRRLQELVDAHRLHQPENKHIIYLTPTVLDTNASFLAGMEYSRQEQYLFSSLFFLSQLFLFILFRTL